MPRYLVRVRPELREEVKARLPPAATVIEQVLDYIVADMPEELVPEVRRIPGVVEVRPEVEKRIAWIPIERKLSRFIELVRNPLTLPQAFAYSLSADAGKVRWPTLESRRFLGAHEAEAEGYTGRGIKVAVLDTGGDPFSLQMLGLGIGHESSVEGQPIPFDENGHSTHVATTIAGRLLPTPFGEIKGVAPDAEVRIFKCLGYGMGAGTESSVMRAMMDAFRWGADVVNMSLGSPYAEEPADRLPECRAIKALSERGEGRMIFVVANGNDGPDSRTVGVPACSPYALSVGAIDVEGKIADFSSRGPTYEGLVKPDCCAPGVNILSSTCGMIDFMQFMDGPKLGAISGTSMATPHCTGIVALIKQHYRDNGVELTTNMLKDMLSRYGRPKDNDYGWGTLTWSMAKRYLEEELK
ncbi:MAG: S8 family serine peptidase [Candidatus Bathyarchaeia archaeon]